MRTPKDNQVATLELAATLLRREAKRAQDFDGSNMWCPRYMYSGIRHLQRNCDVYCDEPGHDYGIDVDDVDCFQPSRYAGTYIAAMSPPVGLAIADFLENVAEGAVSFSFTHLETALRIATNILKVIPEEEE